MGIGKLELWIWKSQSQNGIWSFSYSWGNCSYSWYIRYKIGLCFKRKRKKRHKLHIFLKNSCRHSLSVLSSRSRAVLQSMHLYSKKLPTDQKDPHTYFFLWAGFRQLMGFYLGFLNYPSFMLCVVVVSIKNSGHTWLKAEVCSWRIHLKGLALFLCIWSFYSLALDKKKS